jgi:DNA-binding GntR family transcriptional regulator
MVAELDDLVSQAEAAAAQGDWEGVGTADIDFHRRVVAAVGSVHIESMFEGLLAELRLAFLRLPDHQALHEPFLRRNRRLVDLLVADDATGAAVELDDYLTAAETALLAAVTA